MNNSQQSRRHIGYWIGFLASSMRKQLERELQPFKISAAQWPILEACYEHECTAPSELARIIPVDAAAITRQLDILVSKGLIRRSHSSEDRRCVDIKLTSTGKRLTPKLATHVQANNKRFLSRVSKKEAAELIGIIQKMLVSVGELDGKKIEGNKTSHTRR